MASRSNLLWFIEIKISDKLNEIQHVFNPKPIERFLISGKPYVIFVYKGHVRIAISGRKVPKKSNSGIIQISGFLMVL